MRARRILDRSVIVIHGDHGSMIGLHETYSLNKEKITDRDIIDNYATLFAVKIPGLAPGEVAAQRSIQYLFARHLMDEKDIETHNDIFLKPNKGVVGPDQVRRPMVPIRPKRC